jgi:hypothetical protein
MNEKKCPQCDHLNEDKSKFCAECGAPLQENPSKPEKSTPPGLSAGAVLDGRYRVDCMLSQGVSGAVYRAYDQRLKKGCILKENLDESSRAKAEFERQATVLAKLSHPHLQYVSDYFTIPEQGQYLVMDIVEGEDLGSMAERRGKLEVEQAIEWISQVADGLAYLHAQQPPVTHNAINPNKICIDQYGQAILMDVWPMESPLRERSNTSSYAVVENNRAGGPDVRSDIYALGATLYRLLGGEPPPASIELTTDHSKMKPIEALNPEVPPNVAKAIERAMALDPDQRFQRVTQFKDALQAPVDEGADLAHPEIPVPPTTSPARPGSKLAVILLAGGALAILVLALGALLGGWLLIQGSSGRHATSTVQAIATIAAQVEATSIRLTQETVPIATSVPPTIALLAPTETRLPPPTSAPTDPPTETEEIVNADTYRNDVSDTLDKSISLLDTIGELFGDAADDPNLFHDPKWQEDMLKACQSLEETGDYLAQLPVPPGYEDVQATFIALAAESRAVNTHMKEAIDAFNEGDSELAVSNISSAADHLKPIGELAVKGSDQIKSK